MVKDWVSKVSFFKSLQYPITSFAILFCASLVRLLRNTEVEVRDFQRVHIPNFGNIVKDLNWNVPNLIFGLVILFHYVTSYF